MSKLIMMRGLPAASKSTRAKEIMKNGGNFVRLNKDLLREMLHFSKFSGVNEGITKRAQRILAKEMLENNINVIIDDTNLGKKHKDSWEGLCKELGVKFEMEDLSKEVDLEELFKRDAAREKTVGRHVIISLAMQYDLIGPSSFGDKTKKWVVCDIDGTIADLTHRLHYIKDVEKPDWKSFFNDMSKDTVIEHVKDLVLRYKDNGYPIIFVSGRPDSHRKETKVWLENVAFKDVKFIEGEDYATILMRRAFDHRPDSDVKEDILKRYLKVENIHTCIDDRPRIVKLWEKYNLSVIDVGHGIDF